MQTPTMNPNFSDMQVAGICKMCALESGAAQAIAAYRDRLIAARDAEWEAKAAARDAEIRRECADELARLRAELDELRAALGVAQEAMSERRGYADMWEYKYGETWDDEDKQVESTLSRTEGGEVGDE